MSDTKQIASVKLTADHGPTRKTRHSRGGEELPPAAQLQIVQFEGDPGYYLLYLDSDGRELTDTYHETIEEAMKQAEWEHSVRVDDWRMATKG